MAKYKEENPSRISFEKYIRKETGFSLARKQYPMTEWKDQPYQQTETSLMWDAWKMSRFSSDISLTGIIGGAEDAFCAGYNAGNNCAVGQIRDQLEDLGFIVEIKMEEHDD